CKHSARARLLLRRQWKSCLGVRWIRRSGTAAADPGFIRCRFAGRHRAQSSELSRNRESLQRQSRIMSIRALLTIFVVAMISRPLQGADLKVPANIVAGNDFTITSSNSEGATFYLIGPSQVGKRNVVSGSEINIPGDEIKNSGLYTALLCSGEDCASATFYVKPAAPAKLSLL